ncbi:MAG TPA: tripartite tricarboxylate transporter substrate-binding protein [Burkholderiales bacterium]|nr:tripartite tricarboxylate transporter substrate-binding protein [Burkholderiales bacterium]
MVRIAVSLILLAAAALPAGGALAQAYPTRPVRIIVPAAPGDSCDVLSRLIGQKVGERLGHALTADNRVGAGGQVGLLLIAKAAPDGYTIGCGQGGNMVIVPIANKKVAYDSLRDFVPIQIPVTNFLGLVVHPTVPFKGVKDLVTYGKANPGKLVFGSNGEGAFIHFSVELLRSLGGFTYLHVPYNGVAPIMTDLMSGRIDSTITSFVSVQPHVNAGRLKLLAIGRATRSPKYPDYPTIAETLPGYENSGWFGFIAPAGTPREIVVLLNKEMNRAVMLPDVRAKLDSYGLEIHTESPEFFANRIRSDIEKWGKVARDIGFQPK